MRLHYKNLKSIELKTNQTINQTNKQKKNGTLKKKGF